MRGRIWGRRETRSWKGNGNDKSNNEKHTIKEGEAGGVRKSKKRRGGGSKWAVEGEWQLQNKYGEIYNKGGIEGGGRGMTIAKEIWKKTKKEKEEN